MIWCDSAIAPPFRSHPIESRPAGDESVASGVRNSVPGEGEGEALVSSADKGSR